jgi:hypothetical protein
VSPPKGIAVTPADMAPGEFATDVGQAVALVEAQLGRPAQDALEVAVVLEAWGGLTPDRSHGVAADVIAHPHPRIGLRPRAVEPARSGGLEWQTAIGDLGFVIGVLMTGLWVSELAGVLGDRAVDIAWRVALPFSLGAQWFARRRYLGGPEGMGRLRREFGRSAAVVLVATAAIAAAPGWGPLSAGLALLWIGGFLVARHGWGLPFGVALLAVTAGLPLGIDPRVLLSASAATAMMIGCVALFRTAPSIRRPGPIGRAVPASLIGAGLGLLLVLEPRFPWSAKGVLPTLTVIPSLLGSLWGGVHMSRLWDVLPPALAATSIHAPPAEAAVPGRLLLALWRGALARLLLGTGVGSAIVIGAAWVAPGLAFQGGDIGEGRHIVLALLAAHAVLAVAGLVVALLEAFGRWGWGLMATGGGCAVALAIDLSGAHPFPGVRIFVAAVIALVIGLPVLLRLLHQPARTLAVGM